MNFLAQRQASRCCAASQICGATPVPPRHMLGRSNARLSSMAAGAPRRARQEDQAAGGSRQRGPAALAAEKKKFGSFEEMLAGSEVPLLVDFYATWCGPCQMLSPILSAVSKRMEGRIQVVKIDSEKYSELASKYHIMALPTIILFKDGKPIDRIEGMLDEQKLFDRVNYYLAGHK